MGGRRTGGGGNKVSIVTGQPKLLVCHQDLYEAERDGENLGKDQRRSTTEHGELSERLSIFHILTYPKLIHS
jgi:hypothetical protein